MPYMLDHESNLFLTIMFRAFKFLLCVILLPKVMACYIEVTTFAKYL